MCQPDGELQRLESEPDVLDAHLLPEEAPRIEDNGTDFKDGTLTPAKPQAVRRKALAGSMPIRKKDTVESARPQQVRSLPFL